MYLDGQINPQSIYRGAGQLPNGYMPLGTGAVPYMALHAPQPGLGGFRGGAPAGISPQMAQQVPNSQQSNLAMLDKSSSLFERMLGKAKDNNDNGNAAPAAPGAQPAAPGGQQPNLWSWDYTRQTPGGRLIDQAGQAFGMWGPRQPPQPGAPVAGSGSSTPPQPGQIAPAPQADAGAYPPAQGINVTDAPQLAPGSFQYQIPPQTVAQVQPMSLGGYNVGTFGGLGGFGGAAG